MIKIGIPFASASDFQAMFDQDVSPAQLWDVIKQAARAIKPIYQELEREAAKISSLPSCIGNLGNLTHLYLHDNQLTAVPAEIGNLEKLTRLSLSNNQLTALPLVLVMMLKQNKIWQFRADQSIQDLGRSPTLNIIFQLQNEVVNPPEFNDDEIDTIEKWLAADFNRRNLIHNEKDFLAKFIGLIQEMNDDPGRKKFHMDNMKENKEIFKAPQKSARTRI